MPRRLDAGCRSRHLCLPHQPSFTTEDTCKSSRLSAPTLYLPLPVLVFGTHGNCGAREPPADQTITAFTGVPYQSSWAQSYLTRRDCQCGARWPQSYHRGRRKRVANGIHVGSNGNVSVSHSELE